MWNTHCVNLEPCSFSVIRPLSFAICPSLPFTSVPPQTLGGLAPDFLSEQIQETCTHVEDVHGDKIDKKMSKSFRPERSTKHIYKY